MTGRTNRGDNNYGIYTPDNLFSLNVNLAGAVMQVMQNGGAEPLAPGDLVAFSGINRAVTAVDGPTIRGASWHRAREHGRISHRYPSEPESHPNYGGLRCAASPH